MSNQIAHRGLKPAGGNLLLIVFIRTVILYTVIIIIMRLMGKRQIGQLQPSELVVALVIADLAAVPMAEVGIPLINGIVPIITLFVAEELLSYISLKSDRARGIISGKPSIIVEKGIILEQELRRLRYNINDLLEQLRLSNVFDIADVDFAILETSGQLSIIPKPEKRPLTPRDMDIQVPYSSLPVTVIIDGKVNSANLYKVGLDEAWLHSELKKNRIRDIRDVFFCYLTTDRTLHYQIKSKKTANRFGK